MCWRQKVGFASIGLAMASCAFHFMTNLKCWISTKVVKSTSSTHTSKLITFLGWQYASLMTLKCWEKLTSTSSSCNQYCEYTTHKLYATPWVGNLPCNSFDKAINNPCLTQKNYIIFQNSKFKHVKSCWNLTHMKIKYKLHNYKRLRWTTLHA